MSRKLFTATVVCALMAGAALDVRAQGFGMGYTDIGPTVGLGNVGDASIAFGGRFEKAIKPIPDLGNGIIGVQAGAQYYSWSGGGYSWSYIPIGVTANYHFVLENKKIDPFLGLGLGYSIVSCDFDGAFGGADLCSDSALYFIGRAGGRYFFSPKMALYADAGAGAATINVGLMFKLK